VKNVFEVLTTLIRLATFSERSAGLQPAWNQNTRKSRFKTGAPATPIGATRPRTWRCKRFGDLNKVKAAFPAKAGEAAFFVCDESCVDPCEIVFYCSRMAKKTDSFYYHCDWHASHYVKVMLDQIRGENN